MKQMNFNDNSEIQNSIEWQLKKILYYSCENIELL